MAEESTLLIIKPDAVKRGLAGEILSRIERKGLRIDELRTMRIDPALAERHYAEHAEKPFFRELVDFITSGDVIVAKVSGREGISVLRNLMGATDPAKADTGTLRKEFAESIERNATHGSDAPETAAYEIGFFFAGVDLI